MSRLRICLLGESPLIEEYASLCLNKGLDVQVRVNPLSTGSHVTTMVKLPRGARKITRPPKSIDLALELTTLSIDAKRKNLAELDAALPSRVPILTSSVTATVSEQSSWIGHPERLAGIGALPSFLEGGLIEFAGSQLTDEATLKAADQFARSLGKECSRVQDSVGMVLPRIVCMLANEGFFALAENVATRDDMDTAMKLGTNYPYGPVEWAERIGVRHVLAVVTALYRTLGEDRYRPAPLLQKAAGCGSLPARTAVPLNGSRKPG